MDWFSLGRDLHRVSLVVQTRIGRANKCFTAFVFPFGNGWAGVSQLREGECVQIQTQWGPSTQYWKSCHSEQGSWRKERGTEILESLGTQKERGRTKSHEKRREATKPQQ